MYKLILTGVFCIFLSLFSVNTLGNQPMGPYDKSIYFQKEVISIENFRQYIAFTKGNGYYSKRIVRVIFKYAKKYNLDPLTLLAVINTESHFDFRAKGVAGEIGLGQVMPSIWLNKKTFRNLYDGGVIKPGRDKELKWIGKNVESTAYILNVKREECFNFHKKGTLKNRGYNSIQECKIRRYNGRRGNHEYYVLVTSKIGKYYYFVQSNNLQYYAIR